MSTLQQLKTYAANALDLPYAATPDFAPLAADVDAGRTSFAAAATTVEQLAIQTTGVANLSYEFFTGATVTKSGLDYLISPTGSNPNNLNSAYYQSFNVENRYINFAVTLGENGTGAASFAAAYGSLSLSDTVVKAYTTIFGAAPDAAKTSALLNDMVPNGLGGTYTRAQYFASYGGDGPTGLGTKAALVGWLLSQAAVEDVGVYAKAEDNFVADLAPTGLAHFNVDLLATAYGPLPTSSPAQGASLTFASNQSVSTNASDPALRSTNAQDYILGNNGLDATQSVATGGGDDVINVSGTVSGYIDGGAGNDRISVQVLAAPGTVLGAPNAGTISGGDGDDMITVLQSLAYGARVDGGTGDNTLVAEMPLTNFNSPTSTVTLTGVEHLALIFLGQEANSFNLDQTLDLSAATGLQDVTVLTNGLVKLNNIPDALPIILRQVQGGAIALTYASNTAGSGRGFHLVGASTPIVHLDAVNSAFGGAPPTTLTVNNADGPLQLVVDHDSTLASISKFTHDGSGDTSIDVSGLGRLTTSIRTAVATFDASASAGVAISHLEANTVVFSSGGDQVAADLRQNYSFGLETYTLGAGADVLSVYQDATDTAPAFANLKLTGATVTDYLRVNAFAKGVDHLDLGTSISSPPLALTAAAQGAATLQAALLAVSAQTPADATAVFEYGGDTFVYHQDATVGVNTGDGLVQLVGVTGLTTGASGSAADIRFG